MFRARTVLLATVVVAGFAAGVMAQAVQAPDLKPILAGRQFAAPIRGEAAIEYVPPQALRGKDTIVTKIQVKNISKAPIARLTIEETWYDKSENQIIGGKGFLTELLQPGEVKTITIETPYNPKMARNAYQFSHANGTVPKPQRVAKLVDDSKERAAAAAAAKK